MAPQNIVGYTLSFTEPTEPCAIDNRLIWGPSQYGALPGGAQYSYAPAHV
jgi:hypothetical protein